MFFLGMHRPWWLTRNPVPLRVSARTLADYVPGGHRMPFADVPCAVDSVYTDIRDHGKCRWNEVNPAAWS